MKKYLITSILGCFILSSYAESNSNFDVRVTTEAGCKVLIQDISFGNIDAITLISQRIDQDIDISSPMLVQCSKGTVLTLSQNRGINNPEVYSVTNTLRLVNENSSIYGENAFKYYIKILSDFSDQNVTVQKLPNNAPNLTGSHPLLGESSKTNLVVKALNDKAFTIPLIAYTIVANLQGIKSGDYNDTVTFSLTF